MTDLLQLAAWGGIFVVGIAGCVVIRALGLAATYVRDLLHVGASIWILGWPYWHGAALPVALVTAVALATAALPVLARRDGLPAMVVKSVTSGDETWTGLVHYTAMYAVFTAVGLLVDPFPAAAALTALSLGDGIGGAVGRNFGRHHFQLRGAKRKSIEGSLAVLLAATAGAALVAHLFGRDVDALSLVVLGCVAALAEAVAPRSTDNLLIPIAVWLAATFVL